MKSIVITGSTRGIGFGLADEFLARGHAVTVSGRSQESVNRAVVALAGHHGGDRLHGQPCDVTVYAQVVALWDAAKDRFGAVDIWINNAGLANPLHPFWEQEPDLIEAVVRTNLLGLMYGAKVAFQGMVAQGGGQLYNMHGFGSRGNWQRGMALYGATKRGVDYLSKALIEEAKGTPVQVGTLSPGMVLTDMLLGENAGTGAERERNLRIFNILADRVETVAPFLVDRMLANNKNGTHIRWLTPLKVMGRFALANFRKRDVIGDLAKAKE